MELQRQWLDRVIDLALAEDVGLGDITTMTTVSPDARGMARIWAKEPVVVAGLPVAQRVFEKWDPTLRFSAAAVDGATVDAGGDLAVVSGCLRSILTAERTALNFLQRLSGVATLTRAFVQALSGTGAAIVDTRKTTPGLRMLQKYAVALGGGKNHRWALDSGVLIKDNHIMAAGGVRRAIRAARIQAPHVLRIEVECKNLHQVEEAVMEAADVILLDNMDGEALQSAIQLIGGKALVEVSGGVTLDTVRSFAIPGVDLISVGALTHSARAVDIALDVVQSTHYIRVDECDSTNRVAHDLVSDQVPDWTVVVTERQTAGRGRLGRKWYSLPGNLFASVIFSPQIDILGVQTLSLVAGYALFDTVCGFVAMSRVELKWPNDVLIDGRKVGGILIQIVEAQAGRLVAVVGVGVNLVGSHHDFSDDVRGKVITISEAGGSDVTRDGFLFAFVDRFRQHVAQWTVHGGHIDPQQFFWRARRGRRVHLDGNPDNFVVVSGIDKHGGLVVTHEDGTVQVVQAGDLTPAEWLS